MSYEQDGIRKEWVDEVKEKLKNRSKKERVKALTKDLSKSDLQDKVKVSHLLDKTLATLEISWSRLDKEKIVRYIIAQKIDPHNTFQLIKLWSKFR